MNSSFITHPLPLLRSPPRTLHCSVIVRGHFQMKAQVSEHSHQARRAVLRTLAHFAALPLLPSSAFAASPAVVPASQSTSHRVYFDISIAGRPRGRIVMQLHPRLAPASTRTFEALCTGTLRNRSGRTASYRYAQASRVIKGRRVELGRLNQIDALNQQPGTPQRLTPVIEVPLSSDTNDVPHDRPGLVSVARGGSATFSILAEEDRSLDETNLVIGEVIDGMNIVKDMVNVPTNRKTIRDGYRNIGKLIGDSRANVAVSLLSVCVFLMNTPIVRILFSAFRSDLLLTTFCLSDPRLMCIVNWLCTSTARGQTPSENPNLRLRPIVTAVHLFYPFILHAPEASCMGYRCHAHPIPA